MLNRIPFLRFLVTWLAFLGGLYLALTNIYLGSEQIGISWQSLANDDVRFFTVSYRLTQHNERYIAETGNYSNRTLLGDDIFFLYTSPDLERILFIDGNRLRLTDVLNQQTRTVRIEGGIPLNICTSLTWSPDSQWVALVLLNTPEPRCLSYATPGQLKHVILIDREGEVVQALLQSTDDVRQNDLLSWSADSRFLYFETEDRILQFDIQGDRSAVEINQQITDRVTPERQPIYFDLPEGLDINDFARTSQSTQQLLGGLLMVFSIGLNLFWSIKR